MLSHAVRPESGGQPPVRETQPVVAEGRPDSLAVQLATAAAEIEALRERVFELNSYRTAYERLLGDTPRPPMGNA